MSKDKNHFNEEKEHYKSLISLFKYSLTIIVGVISSIGYLTYSSVKEARDDLKEQFNEMKSEIKSKESKMNDEIASAKKQAFDKVDNIRDTASYLAKIEARNRINQVFNDNHFDQYVSNIAKERMEPQIKTLVDENIKNAKLKELNLSIEKLNSDDLYEITLASNYFHSNISNSLKEDEINRLIMIYRSTKSISAKNVILDIFAFQNSKNIENFFKKESLRDDPNEILGNRGVLYLLKPNVEPDMDFFLNLIKISKSKRNEYMNLLYYSKDLNPNIMSQFLNSKKLIDYVFQFTKKEEWDSLKEEIQVGFKEYMKDGFETTYIYSKQ